MNSNLDKGAEIHNQALAQASATALPMIMARFGLLSAEEALLAAFKSTLRDK